MLPATTGTPVNGVWEIERDLWFTKARYRSDLSLRRTLQQGPQLAHVFQAFQVQNSLDELGALLSAENRRHQITRFSNDFFARHRVLGSASRIIYALT